ncbi:MAG: prepilin-type N-terminal cleavage/methylation domain-containing protein [Phycisphaerales bacterium]|nr:prepilin-type N-terminal cleavage/methylation domain-containing protein [Phycisphaerales bacterium]
MTIPSTAPVASVQLGRLPRRRSDRAGFSLVELLVVIAIIAIVVAIIVPSLGGVRRAAKKTASTVLVNEIKSAAAAFQGDERRLPGYFTPAQMGNPDNANRGFSGMNNILLDLSGGIVRSGTGPTSMGSGQARVGPTRIVNEQVIVDPNLIGSSNAGAKGYFVPSAKNFVKQTDTQKVCVRDHLLLPDLVDTFGNPILGWAENEAASPTVSTLDDFAQKDSGTATKPAARFYWNSNAAFLKSTALGKLGKDQANSLIAPASDTDKPKALAAFLGNPGFPDTSKAADANILPAAARGKLIIQSAGADGIYVSKYDTGGKQIGGGKMTYGHYFSPDGNPGSPKAYKEGDRYVPNDFVDKFDDILAVGGT